MRHIITLLLMLPVLADAQIYIDSYRFGVPAPAPGLLLDSFPGAAAAFSLRKLDNDYTGNVIMVVRSSDQDSSNIGFAGNYLDTVALKNFCGTGVTDSCFVRTWYDQSGDGRHARQGTYANQPSIMIDGQIIYKGNNVVIDRNSQHLKIPGNIVLDSQSIFTALSLNVSVDQTTSVSTVWRADSTIAFSFFGFGASTGAITNERHVWISLASGSTRGSGQTTTNLSINRYLFTHTFDINTPSTEIRKNGSVESLTNTSGGAYTSTLYPSRWNLALGNQSNTSLIEVIVYPSTQSANRAAIETNINAFYSIY